ncbi:MAG: class I tRNA ligase family protein, partial [Bacteroidales bacterium]|nr:class I tRNA ligase family protein [Bacteroidales bacterium]
GRNFSNKIWNAFRLVNSWEINEDLSQPDSSKKAVEWFDSAFNKALIEIEDQFSKYRISDALMLSYKLFWDAFSSWYLETIKPAYQQPIDSTTLKATLAFFDKLLRILHPFMPFITEELWQIMEKREAGESLMISTLPVQVKPDKKILKDFEIVKEIVTQLRSIRKEKNLSKNDILELYVRNATVGVYPKRLESIITKMGIISSVSEITDQLDGAVSFIVKNVEYYLPLGDLVDSEEELAKMEKELEYTLGFMSSVKKKLSNERFVNNAPAAVVDSEKKKLADAEAKVKTLEEQITSLK